MSLEKLVKRASFIDKMDAITGPVSALCYQSGSETLASFGMLLRVAELCVKLPFTISYVGQTGDKKATLYWGAKEVMANLNPELGYIDIIPFYSMRVKYKINQFS